MDIICIDIGGSGIKIGLFSQKKLVFFEKIVIKEKIDDETYIDNFHILEKNVVNFINEKFPVDKYDTIGISSAGTPYSDYIYRWNNKFYINKYLKELGYNVYCLNDGESHLFSSIYEKNYGSSIGLSFGTGIGFGISNENGYLIRFRKSENIELSNISLDLCEERYIHSYCGFEKFVDASNKNFLDFNIRLRQLIRILSGCYNPKVLYIYGGITNDNYEKANKIFQYKVLPIIKSINYIKNNNVKIIFGKKNSALIGAAYYAYSLKNNSNVYLHKYIENMEIKIKNYEKNQKKIEYEIKKIEYENKKIEYENNNLKSDVYILKSTNKEIHKEMKNNKNINFYKEIFVSIISFSIPIIYKYFF